MGGGGGILGGVTDAVGLTDYAGADKAQRQAMGFSEDQLEFTKQQYADWEAVYGPIQDNLGEYFNNLTGEDLANKNLATYAKEFQTASKKLKQTFSQRGIEGSGLEAAAITAMEAKGAEERAEIRGTAEDTVEQQKLGFLSAGLGQGQQITQQIGSAASTGAQTASNMASIKQKQSSDMLGDIAGGATAAAMFMSDRRLKKNVKEIETVNGIKFYEWEWNDIAKEMGVDDHPTKGVIAQEIVDEFPEAVGQNEEGYYYVDYATLDHLMGGA